MREKTKSGIMLLGASMVPMGMAVALAGGFADWLAENRLPYFALLGAVPIFVSLVCITPVMLADCGDDFRR